jgi:Tfp pilus assembly protein PilP
MRKFKILIFLIILILPHRLAFSNDINPFIPKIKDPEFNIKENIYISPLKKWDLFQYDLIGVVLSAQQSYALVETPGGEIYTLSNGDQIGKQNNIITEILIDRLVFSDESKNELILKNHKL